MNFEWIRRQTEEVRMWGQRGKGDAGMIPFRRRGFRKKKRNAKQREREISVKPVRIIKHSERR